MELRKRTIFLAIYILWGYSHKYMVGTSNLLDRVNMERLAAQGTLRVSHVKFQQTFSNDHSLNG